MNYKILSLVILSLSSVRAVPSSFEEVCSHFKIRPQDISNMYEKTTSPSGIELSSIYYHFKGERAAESMLEKKDSSCPFSAFLRFGFIFVASNEDFKKMESMISSVNCSGDFEGQELLVSESLKALSSSNFSNFTMFRLNSSQDKENSDSQYENSSLDSNSSLSGFDFHDSPFKLNVLDSSI